LGMVMGSGTGYGAGGLIGAEWGWRAAFLVVGLPGLLLVALVLLIHEGPRAQTVPASDALRAGPRAPWRVVRAGWVAPAGGAPTPSSIGPLGTWATPYTPPAHSHGDPPLVPRVLLEFGLFTFLATVLGTLAGAFIADRLERARPGAGRLLTIAFSVFAAVPLSVVGILVHVKGVQ